MQRTTTNASEHVELTEESLLAIPLDIRRDASGERLIKHVFDMLRAVNVIGRLHKGSIRAHPAFLEKRDFGYSLVNASKDLPEGFEDRAIVKQFVKEQEKSVEKLVEAAKEIQDHQLMIPIVCFFHNTSKAVFKDAKWQLNWYNAQGEDKYRIDDCPFKLVFRFSITQGRWNFKPQGSELKHSHETLCFRSNPRDRDKQEQRADVFETLTRSSVSNSEIQHLTSRPDAPSISAESIKNAKYSRAPAVGFLNQLLVTVKKNKFSFAIVDDQKETVDENGIKEYWNRTTGSRKISTIFWVNERQRELLNSGNIFAVFLDTTYKLTKQKFKMMILTALLPSRKIFPLAFALVHHETADDFNWFFGQIERIAPSFFGNLCWIMTDCAASMENSIAKLKEKNSRLFHRKCVWHIFMAMIKRDKQNARQQGRRGRRRRDDDDDHEEGSCEKNFRLLVKAKTLEEIQQLSEILDQQLEEGYFAKVVEPIIPFFCLYYLRQQGIPSFGVYSNSPAESINASLKFKIKSRTGLIKLFNAVEDGLGTMSYAISKEFSFFEDCDEEERDPLQVAISLTTGMRRKQFKDFVRTNPEVSTGFTTRSREGVYTCNCTFFQDARFPCLHIINSMQRGNLRPDLIVTILKASMHPFFNVHKLAKFFNKRKGIEIENCKNVKRHQEIQIPTIDLESDQSDDEDSENVISINANLTMLMAVSTDKRHKVFPSQRPMSRGNQRTRQSERLRRSHQQVNREDLESTINATGRRAGIRMDSREFAQAFGMVLRPRAGRRFN